MKKSSFILSLMLLWSSFAASQTIVEYAMDHIISNNYIGNGAQWDPYQLDYGHGKMQMAEAEWQKLEATLDKITPAFIKKKRAAKEEKEKNEKDSSEK